jgi:hypothetical protein
MPTFPSISPTSVSMNTVNPTRITTTLNGVEQREASSGQYFVLTLEFNNLSQTEQRQIRGFFSQVKGPTTAFDYTLPDYIGDSTGGYTGTVRMALTYAAGQSALLIDAVGANPNLKQGDVIKFASHDKVYTVTENTALDSGINYTCKIDPPLRESVTSGTTVTHQNVAMSVRFVGDNNEFNVDPSLYANFTLELQEVL